MEREKKTRAQGKGVGAEHEKQKYPIIMDHNPVMCRVNGIITTFFDFFFFLLSLSGGPKGVRTAVSQKPFFVDFVQTNRGLFRTCPT